MVLSRHGCGAAGRPLAGMEHANTLRECNIGAKTAGMRIIGGLARVYQDGRMVGLPGVRHFKCPTPLPA